MRITMKATIPASRDGVTTELFRKGDEYNVPKPLGKMLVKEGLAETAKEKEAPEVNKQAKGPQENKQA